MATPLHGAHRRVTGHFAVSIEVEVGERRYKAGCMGWRTAPRMVLRRYATLREGLEAVLRHAEAGRRVTINARRQHPLPMPASLYEWHLLKTCAALPYLVEPRGAVLDVLARGSEAAAWSRSVPGRWSMAVGEGVAGMERALARE